MRCARSAARPASPPSPGNVADWRARARTFDGWVSAGMWPVAVGLFVGIAGALATGRLIRGLLFGVAPTDPVTLAATSMLFLVGAFCACLVPGHRAARVDPVIALRSE